MLFIFFNSEIRNCLFYSIYLWPELMLDSSAVIFMLRACTYWAGHSQLCSLLGWVQISWAGAWTAVAPGSTACRWEWSSPARRLDPTATRGGSVHYRHDGRRRKDLRVIFVSDWQTSDFMYAAAPFAALMITYGTRSPRFGALPASLFLILQHIEVQGTSSTYTHV